MAPTYYGAPHLAGMFAKFGVPVEWGLYCVRGIVDEADEEMLRDGATFVGRQHSVLVKTGDLPGIKAQDIITVEGVRRRVLSTALVDDGALTRLLTAPE